MAYDFLYWIFNSPGGHLLFLALVLPGLIAMAVNLGKGDPPEPPANHPPPTIINNITVVVDGKKVAQKPKPKNRLDRYFN